MKNVQIRSFLQSSFFRIRTEYGDLIFKLPYSVQIWESKNQKKLRIREFLHGVCEVCQ